MNSRSLILSLQAETAGNANTPHGDGIQITNTNGAVSLFIAQVHDLSSLQANLEAATTDKYYQFSSLSRPYLLAFRPKTLSKMASNDAFWRVAA